MSSKAMLRSLLCNIIYHANKALYDELDNIRKKKQFCKVKELLKELEFKLLINGVINWLPLKASIVFFLFQVQNIFLYF